MIGNVHQAYYKVYLVVPFLWSIVVDLDNAGSRLEYIVYFIPSVHVDHSQGNGSIRNPTKQLGLVITIDRGEAIGFP